MADAPLGVPSGDASLDGEVSSRAVAYTLRNLADWLDAHPSAVVHSISLIDQGNMLGPAQVYSFAAGSVDEMYEMARGLDAGSWTFVAGETGYRLSRDVTPGLRFEFWLSRPKAETIADAA